MFQPASQEAKPPRPLVLLLAAGALLLASAYLAHVEQDISPESLRLGDGVGLVIAHMLTDLGNFYVLLPLVLLAATLWRDRDEVQDMLVFLAVSGLLGMALKAIVARSRPDLLHLDSWPSGHSAAAMSFALAFWRRPPSVRFAAMMLAVAVGVSRVLVGRHWPADVLAGFAIAVVSATLTWLPRFLPSKCMLAPQQLAIIVPLAVLHVCNLAHTTKLDKFMYQAATIVLVLALTLSIAAFERERRERRERPGTPL